MGFGLSGYLPLYVHSVQWQVTEWQHFRKSSSSPSPPPPPPIPPLLSSFPPRLLLLWAIFTVSMTAEQFNGTKLVNCYKKNFKVAHRIVL